MAHSPPVYGNVLESIGNTPLLRAARLDTGPCELFLKLESQNPGGSIKDRIGLSMIAAAEAEGRIAPGGTLIEATAGNTGLGLALVAAQKGYRLISERLESKKISKTNAVTSMIDYEVDADNVHVGPSDYVPWLKDRKWCHIRMEGTTYGDVPLNLELKLEVWDSPNSAGVITDAIRCAKLGLDRGLAGTLVAPSSYFMKSPPVQIHDDVAHARVEAFIRGDDSETLVGTEAPRKRQLRRLAGGKSGAAAGKARAAAGVR